MPLALTRRPRILRGPYIEEPLNAHVTHTPRLLLRPHRLADAERQTGRGAKRLGDWPVPCIDGGYTEV